MKKKAVLKLGLVFGILFILGSTVFVEAGIIEDFLNFIGQGAEQTSTQDKLADHNLISQLRNNDSNEAKDDFTKRYFSNDKRIEIEDEKNIMLLDLELETPYKNHVGVGDDILIAKFKLNDFDIDFGKLDDSIHFYNLKNNLKEEQKNYTWKYLAVDEILNCYNETNNQTQKIEEVCYNSTRENWTEFNSLSELPSKNIEIGLFTNTNYGDYIEFVPTIKGFEVLEWASYLADGLVLYYKLDETSGNYTDSIGTSDATPEAGVTMGITGKINFGAKPDGSTDDGINTNYNGQPNGEIYSWCMWAKPGSLGDNSKSFLFGRLTPDTESANYFINNDGTLQADYKNAPYNVGTSSLKITVNNQWYFICFSKNNDSATWYINGSTYSEIISPGSTGALTNTWGIGYDPGYTSRGFNGTIDEFAFYSIAINSTHVDDLYNSGSGLSYPFEANDTTEPIFTTIPADDSITYGTDWSGVDFDATDETGFGTFSINDTRFTINSTGFLDDNEILPFGNYSINVSINDTSSNTNFTTYGLIITQSSSNCDVLFNETSPITYPATFQVYSNCDSTFTLYKNGSVITNNSVQNLGAGSWNFTAVRTDQTNYSNFYDSEIFVVSKASAYGSISGTTPIIYETAGDVTGSESNTGDGDVTYKLYRDGIDVSTPDTTILGAGSYNYIYNSTEGANYSANSSIGALTLVVNQNPASCNVLFNDTSPLEYGKTILVWSNCTSAFVLYKNGTIISNASTQSLTVGTWNFTVSRNDSVNYSNIYDSQIISVQDTTKPFVKIIYPTNTIYPTNITILNYSYSDLNSGSCWYSINNGTTNSTSVSAGTTNFTGISDGEGARTWTLFCNDSYGNENSTLVNFEVDTTNPSISTTIADEHVYYRSGGENFNISINYSVADANFNYANYSVYLPNGTLFDSNSSSSQSRQINLSLATTGEYRWVVWANDTLGNFKETIVDFILDIDRGGGATAAITSIETKEDNIEEIEKNKKIDLLEFANKNSGIVIGLGLLLLVLILPPSNKITIRHKKKK